MSITETLHLDEFLATLDEFLVHSVEPIQEARPLHLWGFCPASEWHEAGESCHCGPFSEYSEGGDE